MGEFVRLEVEDRIGTIRLDRPPVNAIGRQVSTELRAAVLEAGARDDVRAVLVSGGPRMFSAGADIKEMVWFGPEDIRPSVEALGEALVLLEELPKVTFAAIEGAALGGGCELALACDFRIASREAQLGQSEIRIGVIPGAGGTQRLTRLVGWARARDLVFTGRSVEAPEALEIGLVDGMTEPGEALDAARSRASAFVEAPSRALAAAKEALNAAALRDLRTGLGVEREVFVSLFSTEDQKEGMHAFLEKREPRFQGR